MRELKKVLTRVFSGILILGAVGMALAVEISPSRPQGALTNDIPNRSTGAPSLFPNPLRWAFGNPHSAAMQRVNAPPNFKVELTTEPKNFIPESNAVLRARMTVINEGKDKYILEFKTAQHYDFTIRSHEGEEIFRSSKEKIYTQQMSSMVLNRNEKLVYEEEVFSPSNQVINLPPGQYKLIGEITSQVPISVESTFQISP